MVIWLEYPTVNFEEKDRFLKIHLEKMIFLLA